MGADDNSVARRRRSPKLGGAFQELLEKTTKDRIETRQDRNKTGMMSATKHPKKVFKRKNGNFGGPDDTAEDCANQCKRAKTADVKDQKEAGVNTVTPAPPAASANSLSISIAIDGSSKSKGSLLPEGAKSKLVDSVEANHMTHENPKIDVTIDKITQMQFIRNALDELKNVPDITEMINDTDQITTEVSSSSAPALVSEGIGGKFQTVNFYWLDMFEDPDNPGLLFIFGKFKSPPPGNGYSNGCVVVKNLNRRVFLLPRQTKADGTPVDYMDVYNEFYTVFAPKLKLPWFQCRRSRRTYCFDIEGIPPVADYVEVRYSGQAPVMPEDVNGETFSHAFGTNTSLMETFLLEKKLKGPCWLQLSYCERVEPDQQKSWSKFEFTCDVSSVNIHPDNSTFPTPTLVLASIKTETVYDAASDKSAIIFAGVAVNRNVSLELPVPPNEICHDFFCLLNTPPDQIWPVNIDSVTNERILKMDSERNLLECLVNKLHEVDADVYLGFGLKLDRLLNRLWDLRVPNWSRIGRLKRSTPTPVIKSSHPLNSRYGIQGRLLCSVNNSAVLESIWTHSYNPKSLPSVQRTKKEGVVTLFNSEIKALFESSESLGLFVKWGMKLCVLNIEQMNELKVLPLAFQMTCIAGNTLSRSLLGNCLYQTEYLMLHAFDSKDCIVPDEYQLLQQKDEDGREDVRGSSEGIELKSVEGFYESHVLRLEFSSGSLYPCAIQELNIFSSDEEASDDGAVLQPRGTMQKEIQMLGKSRKQVESLMKMKAVTEDEMRQMCDIRAEALEWTMVNAMCELYGDWRFRSKNLDAYVKAKVQEMLLKFKELVEKMGFEVIFGNEKSVLIQTGSRDISTVLEIQRRIQQEIQWTYPFLPVDDVAIYRSLLLLKNNKYAGLRYNPGSQGTYELDLEHFNVGPSSGVPIIVSKTAHACLTEILVDQSLPDKIYKVAKVLWDVRSRLRNGAVPVKELLISKIFTKNPEEFQNIQGLCHVTVALRMNKSEKLAKKFGRGDQVSHVMCTDGRARHWSEMKDKKRDREANVKPDADYYLARMIHPVVSELCAQFPGLRFDDARVADALGCSCS